MEMRTLFVSTMYAYFIRKPPNHIMSCETDPAYREACIAAHRKHRAKGRAGAVPPPSDPLAERGEGGARAGDHFINCT